MQGPCQLAFGWKGLQEVVSDAQGHARPEGAWVGFARIYRAIANLWASMEALMGVLDTVFASRNVNSISEGG